MTEQTNLSEQVLSTPVEASRSLSLARALSALFNPLLINVAAFIIVGVLAVGGSTGLTWALICIVTQALPIVVFYAIRLKQGVYTDGDISVRSQRHELYIFSLIALIVGSLVLVQFGLPRPFLALLVSAIVIGVINGTINTFWKISAHSTSMATMATVGLMYVTWLGMSLWACSLMVGWARVKTRNHTPGQVFAGLAVAALVVTVVFDLML